MSLDAEKIRWWKFGSVKDVYSVSKHYKHYQQLELRLIVIYPRLYTYNKDAIRAALLAKDSSICLFEPLAQLIRQETALEGITIGGREHKICLYADNVLVALKTPASSIPLLMDLLTMYGTFSGYTLNNEITQALFYNCNPPQDLENRYNFKWNSKSIKYLVVKLTKDATQWILYNG